MGDEIAKHVGTLVGRGLIPSFDNGHHPRVLALPGLAAILGIALIAEGGLLVSSGAIFQAPLAAVDAGSIIALTNQARAEDDLGKLDENAKLDAAAQAKAIDMAARGYFSHAGPDGREPWDWISSEGYDYQFAGENLAVRFEHSDDVVRAWMQSPAHRDNLLKSQYRDIGIGVASGTYQGKPAMFVVQFFGTAFGETAAARPATTSPAAVAWSNTPSSAFITGTVAGVSVVAPATSRFDSSLRAIARVFGAHREAVSAVLSGVVLALLILLMLTLAQQARTRLRPHPILLVAAGVSAVLLALAFYNGSPVQAGAGSVRETASAQKGLATLMSVGSDAVMLGPVTFATR